MNINQKGAIPILILISVIGLVTFTFIASSAPFKDQIFSQLFPKKSSQAASAPLPASTASLSLSPSEGQLNKRCIYSLDINLDSGGNKLIGADVILKFDVGVLSVEQLTPGTIFPDYPPPFIDNKRGLATISGFSQAGGPFFESSGKFATLNIKVKNQTKLKSTSIRFDFDPLNPLKTIDSNVVDIDTNEVLSKVVDGNYQVSTGSCSPLLPPPTASPTPPLPSPTSSPVISPTPVPTQSPSPTPTLSKAGDINDDGSVGLFDFSIMLSKWGTSDLSADLNKDGNVGLFDFSLLLTYWGT